jgi:hypothetical protein
MRHFRGEKSLPFYPAIEQDILDLLKSEYLV